jgi:hypothetical protein
MKRIALILMLMTPSWASAQEAGTKARFAYEHWYCWNLIRAMNEKNGTELVEKMEFHAARGIEYANKMYDELEKYGEKNNENWSNNAPMFFRWSLAGASRDFVVGRLFEATINSSRDEIFKENGEYLGETVRQFNAYNDYYTKNCKLLN